MATSCRTGRTTGASRKAFTLIEVLVVVAIIALLISILLPSLKQARDVSRLVVCETHLKEIGTGVNMYLADFKDVLPGPLHPVMLKYPFTAGSTDEVLNQQVREWYVSTRLRKYFGESNKGRGSMTKQVGICPAFPVSDETFRTVGGGTGGPIFNYVLNSSKITRPYYYFGFSHGGVAGVNDWNTKYGKPSDGDTFRPKKISQLGSTGRGPGKKSLSSEWMMADAFRRPYKASGNWPKMDEPGWDLFPTSMDEKKQNYEWGSCPPDIQVFSNAAASAQVVPTKPFHLGGGYKRVGGRTEFTGKVNTLYFDSHVESQNGWKGSVMPDMYD